MRIIVEVRTVYGNETIYPVCPQAQRFARIAGTKTLTRKNLETIVEMGVAIETRQPAMIPFGRAA